MKTKKPVNRDGFNRYRARLQERSPVHRIDALFAMELEVAIAYYHAVKQST